MIRNTPLLLLVIVGLVVAISCSVNRSAKCAPHALLDKDGTIIGGELKASDRELTCGLTKRLARRALEAFLHRSTGSLLMTDTVGSYGAGRQFYNEYYGSGILAIAEAGSGIARMQFLPYRSVVADVQRCMIGPIMTQIVTSRGVYFSRSGSTACSVGRRVQLTAAGPDPIRVAPVNIQLPE